MYYHIKKMGTTIDKIHGWEKNITSQQITDLYAAFENLREENSQLRDQLKNLKGGIKE